MISYNDQTTLEKLVSREVPSSALSSNNEYVYSFRANTDTLTFSRSVRYVGEVFSLQLFSMAAALTEGTPVTPLLIWSISAVEKERREASSGQQWLATFEKSSMNSSETSELLQSSSSRAL